MAIYEFIEKHFDLLKTPQGWVLLIFGAVSGFSIYHLIHRSALGELQLKKERLDQIVSQQSLTGVEISDLQKTFLRELIL